MRNTYVIVHKYQYIQKDLGNSKTKVVFYIATFFT